MKKALLCLLLAGCSHGQIHAENDLFAYANKNHDRFYSHGSKFSYYKDEPDERKTYSLSQTIYTPSKKRSEATPEELKDNRPYTGWLYLEYRDAVRKENYRQVLGIQAGCSGRCSFAKETQVGVHKLLGQGSPTWDRNYSLKSEPGVILQAERYYALLKTDLLSSDYFALLKAGNIIDSVSVGSSFRYGFNAGAWDPEAITFKTERDIPVEVSPWSYYLFGSAEGRFIAYNHFLEGSLFQDERHTVNPQRLVGEGNIGFRVGYKNLKLSYNYTVFSDEWSGQNGPFFIGGIDVSW